MDGRRSPAIVANKKRDPEAPLIMHVDADWRKLLDLENLEYNGAVRRLSRDFITHLGT